MTIQKTNYSRIEKALEAAYPEKLEYARKAAWAEYRLLLKAAAAPTFFWRPIEECPQDEEGKPYLAVNINGEFVVLRDGAGLKYWNGRKGNVVLTHFAEIPPLPTNEEQNDDQQS